MLLDVFVVRLRCWQHSDSYAHLQRVTDKLDAFTIAEYGERMTPELSDLKPDDLLKISDLITVRTQCLEIVKQHAYRF